MNRHLFERGVRDRLEERLGDAGVSATDFRGQPVLWSPPTLGFSGQLDMPHRLGRIPKGIILIRGTVALSYSADPGQVERWTRERVSIWVDRYHHLASGRPTLAAVATDVTFLLLQGRPTACTLHVTATFQDNGAADRPPVKMLGHVTSGADIIGVSLGLANGGTLGSFSSSLNTTVRTNLHPDDEFVWLVV